MNVKEIQDKLAVIIKENTEFLTRSIDDFTQEDDINSLGINSIEFIKIIVGIETEFDIEFEDQDLDTSRFPTLAHLIAYINERIDLKA